jgi:hypothetical protein
MAPAHKKVCVWKLNDPAAVSGYVQPGLDLGLTEKRLDLMDRYGVVYSFALNEIKAVVYVKDFIQREPWSTCLGRPVFSTRPKTEGLWLRLSFVDGTTQEGLAASDLKLLEELSQEGGVTMSLPDARANAQRLFVPVTALASLEVLGVVRKGTRQQGPAAQREEVAPQPTLFGPL